MVNRNLTGGPTTSDELLTLLLNLCSVNSTITYQVNSHVSWKKFHGSISFVHWCGSVQEVYDSSAYHNFPKLSFSYRILSSAITDDNLEFARQMLEDFVQDFTNSHKEFVR